MIGAAGLARNIREGQSQVSSSCMKEGIVLRRIAEHPPTALQGYTVGVKDNIVTTSLPSSCASNILRGYVAPQKATVVELMENAGMAVAGKTNMDEFGMGSHNLNSAFGAMSQPWSSQSVGGSSGGSALAVAARDCHIAIGTDTGGSVRLPAAYLNLCGFKPSYGLISRYGVVPYANSLDTVGILSKTPIDAFLLFNILAQPDFRDPTCLTEASRQRIREARATRIASKRQDSVRAVSYADHYSRNMTAADLRKAQQYDEGISLKSVAGIYKDYSGLRHIGVPTDYNIAELQPEVRHAWKTTIATLREIGHTIVPINLPTTQHALSAYYILAPAEASSNLAKYDGIRYGPVRTRQSAASDSHSTLYSHHRGTLFGDEVKRRILLGSFSLSASSIDNYFLQAQRVRRLVQQDFNQVFRMAHPLLPDATGVENGVDYILCPTAPSYPPDVRKLKHATPPESYMNDVFTVPASLAGLPAMSVPAPPAPGKRVNDTSRSVGMQVIGQYGDDIGVLQFVGRSLWRNTEWMSAKAGNVAEGRKMR
jgi:aspartyl-tRNA(Asn)/glutamyl-tRNA(Gln) amidotransferase subunit A